ncbi:MAG: hypothetical protein HFE75_12220 [Firmicutes bacterium]|jgi:FtsH-binding integral membrane protein|nr:hypothetical protein [Bacillota bacterium]NBI64016.1 hypothetical protein [Clostridiales bacterium]
MSGNLMTNKQERFTLYQGQKQIGQRAYNLIIGATLLYGFAVNAFMITAFEGAFDHMNQWVFLIGYIVCVIIGAMLTRSDSPVVSFVGYNFIVVPLGVVLTMLLPYYGSQLVFDAVLVTGAITLVMMIAGSAFPNLFLSMGRTLAFTLLAVILVELVCVLILHRDFAIFDYAIVLIFSGYIGYDWAKANAYQRTVDNAIDSAVDLYMDIINIFIRILAIMSRND